MRELFLLREHHDQVFASMLSEHETIPWRPLTIGEFLDVQDRFTNGAYPNASLEDEIFKKCVLSQVFIDNMGKEFASTNSANPAMVRARVRSRLFFFLLYNLAPQREHCATALSARG